MPENEPISPPTPDLMSPLAAGLPHPDAQQDPDRNKKFDEEMEAFTTREREALMNKDLSTAEYSERSQKLEEEEYTALQRWQEELKKNPESLSDNQRHELDARINGIEYNKETYALESAVSAEGATEEQKAAYQQRMQDFKEYRGLLADSPEFGNNQHIQNLKMLDARLDNAATAEERTEIQADMATEMRGFRQDLQQGDKEETLKNILSFVDRNKDNAVVKGSGMVAMADVARERMGWSKEQEQEIVQAPEADKDKGAHELEQMQVTPAGAPTAGAVAGADKGGEAAQTAEGEVSASVDSGNGDTRVRLEGGVEVAASSVQNQSVPDARGPETVEATR